MNVTPESEVPIIPNATKYQVLCLLPEKNACESAFLEVQKAIANKTAK
jgi:hypothetical protein